MDHRGAANQPGFEAPGARPPPTGAPVVNREQVLGQLLIGAGNVPVDCVNLGDLDLLEGLHAYDEGCTDSGIRDEVGRAKLREKLRLGPTARSGRCDEQMELVRLFLVRAALPPYSCEDVAGALDWLRSSMGVDWL